MKSTNTQVHLQGGKKTVSPQAPNKAKSIVRARPTVDEMRNGRLLARNVVKPVRGVPDTQLAAVSSALGLSAEKSRALKLISEWEGLSPAELCNRGFAGCMESSFGDLQGFAFGRTGGRPKEQTWARKFYPAVKEFFTESGELKEFPEPTLPVATPENIRNVAICMGRMGPDELNGSADSLEEQVRELRAVALAVANDPKAWDRAGAPNLIHDGPSGLDKGEREQLEDCQAAADGESPDDAKGGLDPIKSKTPVTLVFTGPDGREVARVAMSGQLFTGLKVAARKLGESMSEFIEQAVRESLERDAASLKGGTL